MTVPPKLTDRELEILRQVATGASNREIAQTLFISANTVKVHLSNIFQKLGVASRTEATLYAIQAGLVEGMDGTQVVPVQPWWRGGWVIAGGALVIALIAIMAGALLNPGEPPPENVVDLEQLELERWQELAPMPTARKGLAVAAYDGKIYAIAGETEDGVTDVVERYDPATDTWETLPPKPTAVTDVQAAVIGGKIYVPGGVSSAGDYLNVLEVFNPQEGKWDSGSPIPLRIASYGIISYQGAIYLFGGLDGEAVLDNVLRYDPNTNAWNILPRMINPIFDTNATSTSVGILVIGGRSSTQKVRLNSLYTGFLEASRESWIQFEPIPEDIAGGGVITVADIVHVFAGGDENIKCKFYKYFVHRDGWECQAISISFDVSEFGITELDNQIYIIGGEEHSEILTRTYSYKAIYSVLLPVLK